MTISRRLLICSVATFLLLLSACSGKSGNNTSTTSPTVTAAAEPSATPSVSASASPTATQSAAPSADVSAAPSGEQTDDSDVTLRGSEDMGQEYIDRITFLGDSTTYGMKHYAVLKDGKNTKQVWTPSNGTFTLSYQGFVSIVYPEDGSEIPIRDAVKLKKPEMMIITLGVNGISFMDEDYFKSEYKTLVSDIMKISPETKIILQSIFPVASNYDKLDKINNDKITEANKWVLDVAKETGAKYLDTYSVLVGSDGYMNSDYQNGDGMHLNAKGFDIELNFIKTHGYK